MLCVITKEQNNVKNVSWLFMKRDIYEQLCNSRHSKNFHAILVILCLILYMKTTMTALLLLLVAHKLVIKFREVLASK